MENKIIQSKIFAHYEISVSVVSVRVAQVLLSLFTIQCLEDYRFQLKFQWQMISLIVFINKMVMRAEHFFFVQFEFNATM